MPKEGARPPMWRGPGLEAEPRSAVLVERGNTVATKESRAGIATPWEELRTDSCTREHLTRQSQSNRNYDGQKGYTFEK